MASFEEDVCFWESVDVESDFQADTTLFRDANCDDLLEFNETFKPLWQTDARIAATIDGTVEIKTGCIEEANIVEIKTEKQSPAAPTGTGGGSTPRQKLKAEEEALLLKCKKDGNKRSKISALIETKSTIQVKTHAHYLLRKSAHQGRTSGQAIDNNVLVATSKGPVSRPPKKQMKTKPQATSRNENVIVLKEAEAIETLKNKFLESEIVSIDKSADEEDDIDIDCDGTDDVVFSPPSSPIRKSDALVRVATPKLATDSSAEDTENEISSDRPGGLEKSASGAVTFEPPVAEVVLEKSEISKDEKIIHSEFFSGSSSKTPERYLRIRNFIIVQRFTQRKIDKIKKS
ncbi:hypothetical protein HPB51_012814 [Rhipicephalus microplus]|uniref:SWIRM domain-containing protein n=1 Tax=Rhipicephalus microplus TaxID=6941 RepID=A0A9J6E9U0_RHIMP|nr:histone H2A deubiquitinase MYSM1-like [Rhipicephalus microplus]KAH8031094.1 hypothetical protein HPB51_012814 [Rhipicephalus microplus]